MQRIKYSRQALKMLGKIDRPTTKRIIAKVEQLAKNPESLSNNITAMKGGNGTMRLRLGNWRVIFTADGLILSVTRIAPRGSVYD